MLSNLKKVLTKWQSHISQDMDQQMQVAFDPDPQARDSFSKSKMQKVMRNKINQ